jgi:hypothetical protein
MATIEKHKISDTISIQLRTTQKTWVIRFKDPITGKWKDKTSGETDLVKAIAVATSVIEKSSPTFENVAEEWFKSVTKSNKHNEYYSYLSNWLFPYIGKVNIDKIDQVIVNDMNTERFELFDQKYKRMPSKSTLLNWNSATNKVFDYAITKGIVHHTQLPKLDTKGGLHANRRVAFTDTQLRQIRKSEFWITETKNEKSKSLRRLLRNYTELLLGTGLRHGTETENLSRFDIDLTGYENDQRHMSVTVRKGKTTLYTGDRVCIVKDFAIPFVHNISKQAHDKDHMLIAISKSGAVTGERLAAVFRQLLEFENLTGKSLSLYSYRHTYITKALLSGVTPATICAQCGTSLEMLDKHYGHLTASMAVTQLR